MMAVVWSAVNGPLDQGSSSVGVLSLARQQLWLRCGGSVCKGLLLRDQCSVWLS
jgi:hypothetical protein